MNVNALGLNLLFYLISFIDVSILRPFSKA